MHHAGAVEVLMALKWGKRMKGICILGGFGGRDDISVDA